MPARTVSIKEKVKWKFYGNMNSSALTIGDVDNDKDNEFIVGNIHGTLGIFKHITSRDPWLIAQNLGTITCVAVGDVRNSGKNSIVCINAEGEAHIFDVNNIELPLPDSSNTQGSRQSSPHVTTNIIHPTFTVPVPVNISRILIADIDGDGLNELILGRTDRYLHSYSLILEDLQLAPNSSTDRKSSRHNSIQQTTDTTPTDESKLPNSTIKASVSNSVPPADDSPAVLPSYSSAALATVQANVTTKDAIIESSIKRKTIPPPIVTKDASPSSSPMPSVNGDSDRQSSPDGARIKTKAWLSQKKMWSFDGQLGTLAVSVDSEDRPLLLVAQPGGTYVTIDYEGKKLPSSQTLKSLNDPASSPSPVDPSSKSSSTDNFFLKNLNETMTFNPIRYNTAPNNTIASDTGGLVVDFTGKYALEVGTEIVAGLKRGGRESVSRGTKDHNDLIALVTMDGTITLHDPHYKTQKLSDLQVNHQLFSASKLNLISPEIREQARHRAKEDDAFDFEESDQVVACSWDGTTYIVDTHLNAVQVVGGERVCAFAAAMYAIQPGKNVPCFFYVNFEDDITVYYNVYLKSIPTQTLIEVITGQPHSPPAHHHPTSYHSYNNEFYDKFDSILRLELPDYQDWVIQRNQDALLSRFSHPNSGLGVNVNVATLFPKSLPDLFKKCLYDQGWVNQCIEQEDELDKEERELLEELRNSEQTI
ncbi:hypothetical protein BKA69DRAFT_1124783 [Paraphysoderma sedebokerense]|nr:hypothetical protein BKA69DRAFT_1124783 [Paraphysoderma sedebokerense]